MHQSVYSNLFILRKKEEKRDREERVWRVAPVQLSRDGRHGLSLLIYVKWMRERKREKDTRVLCFFRQLTSNPHKKGETVVFQRTKWIEKVANPHFILFV